ncbi:hypothetical protein C474_08927 [Halogeometricum pallidum JCM 14848]|uniref:Type II secretion system protein GspF domain-containing protein n=1 Tax=Halogeometricum pallidum JCM 14848 TaxID=1227487 RepID=M0D9A8_HALPD|nr:type II secretion system F family protein [Halogeometricum pallidum]ELZ31413.1 hypothetical protein C474_08927 [Halogeometricum pallidum JCM 14848]
MSTGFVERGVSDRTMEAFGDTFYPFYRRLFGSDSDFAAGVERKLAESRMPYNVEMYLSVALAAGTASGLALWFAGLVVGYLLFVSNVVLLGPVLDVSVSNQAVLATIEAVRVPALVVVTGLVFGSIGFGIGFGTTVFVPYLRSGARRREINLLLPDAVSFMYALSIGGMSQLEIFEAIADADDTYGEVSREFRTIMLETEYFDTDYRSAIRKQAFETPSAELSQFLTDMLSVIDSGGDITRFFDDKKALHFRTAKQEQEDILETLELFAEVFVTLSLFPLLLIIVLIVLSMLGEGQEIVLYLTVYLLIPMFGGVFIVILSTITQDELGDGVLRTKERAYLAEDELSHGLFGGGFVDQFTGRFSVFDRIARREGSFQTLQIVRRPHLFLRDNPTYTLALTVPTAAMLVGVAVLTGSAPTTWDGLVAEPIWGTFVYMYLPAFVIGIPVVVFYEWNVRSRYGILDTLSETLRKLASANDTGLTLLDSVRTVVDTSSGRLSEELEIIYTKSSYGMNISESFIVFNNKYRLPALARTVKLITRAQEASGQISSVLTTAAQAAENRDDIERDRRSRTRMQVVIVVMTYLTLLGVMAILKVRFIDVLAQLASQQGASSASRSFMATMDASLLSLLFFHAVTLQAVVTGLVSGYVRDARLLSGAKYVVGLLVVSLLVWGVVG